MRERDGHPRQTATSTTIYTSRPTQIHTPTQANDDSGLVKEKKKPRPEKIKPDPQSHLGKARRSMKPGIHHRLTSGECRLLRMRRLKNGQMTNGTKGGVSGGGGSAAGGGRARYDKESKWQDRGQTILQTSAVEMRSQDRETRRVEERSRDDAHDPRQQPPTRSGTQTRTTERDFYRLNSTSSPGLVSSPDSKDPSTEQEISESTKQTKRLGLEHLRRIFQIEPQPNRTGIETRHGRGSGRRRGRKDGSNTERGRDGKGKEENIWNRMYRSQTTTSTSLDPSSSSSSLTSTPNSTPAWEKSKDR
ncbi:MAG: hypothetical protein M1823_001476 [Watsoniomyces obsoletus]|nr:MAG: hypothetical protein M1823_001476 [Watsoniomyces obsoletus]